MTKRKVAMVVASNRPEALAKFYYEWQCYPWDLTIVVCDSPMCFSTEAYNHGTPIEQYCWRDIDALGERGKIFSRQDAAIKSFGFLKAYHAGATVICCLDDDCLPDAGKHVSFIKGHLDNLTTHQDLARSTVPGLRVRGLPYRPLAAASDATAISVGLWTEVPDLDAASTLVSGVPFDFIPPIGTQLCDPDFLYPMSGMNLSFNPIALPLMYFPKMGQGSKYRRFDDIWAGLFAQAAMRAMGWRMRYGEPFVRHSRLSDPFKNLEAEAPGLAMNEALWKFFGNARPPFLHYSSQDTVEKVVDSLCQYMLLNSNQTPDPDYVERWALNIGIWMDLLKQRI